VTDQAAEWAGIVASVAEKRGARYEEVGGLNPIDRPAALCVGGANRLTGELARGFWGSSCDADEEEVGRLFSKSVVPGALLAKSHMPDLAKVMPAFDVESLEARPEDFVQRHVARKVEFESLEFNRRFLATVPEGYDPIALRELFGPGLIDWVTTIDHEIDFGVAQEQLWFLWRYRERGAEELEQGLDAAGELFRRVRREMEEHGVATYPTGPWHAGMEPFPAS
jgi:hypothetical protein